MKKFPLYLQIIIGLVGGLVAGLALVIFNLPNDWVIDFIKPFGTIFMRLLKMIAVPMVLVSLLLGILSLQDIGKLSKLGVRTLGIYFITTVLAITTGLLLVNIIKPGLRTPENLRHDLSLLYQDKVSSITTNVVEQPLLQPLIDMVPENIFMAFSSNSAILQVVFFTLILGVAFIRAKSSQPFTPLLESANTTILKLVDIIMLFAPIGVFALMMSMVIETSGNDVSKAVDLLQSLLWYSFTVIAGLIIVIAVVYISILKLFTKVPLSKFFRSIRAVQLLAFSTSSSNATLPLTMKRCEEQLGVPKEISGFVLPLGATVNMDGTSLYQGVAAVFIAQVMGIELTIFDQLMIVFTATLASIGAAGVPGSGLVMMVIILQSVGIPIEGLAIILAVDRILDMFRTVVNVTGDAVVALVMTRWMGKKE
jgi:proton glutamate symport protein